jgi:hypothetical protein
MAELRATPMSNPIMGLLADRLKKAQQFGAKPFGYENPPVEMLMNLLGVPAVQQTMERMAYGEPLTTGRGMTTKPRAEAIEAAMAVAPVAGLLGKATKGLPVGASIKNVGEELIYHGTSPKAAKAIEKSGFDVTKSADGTIWFTSNPNIGEVAATGKGAVVKRFLNEKKMKLGGWDETDKYSTDELIQKGFDGLKLKDSETGEITYQIFNPEKLSVNKSYISPQQEALDTAQRNAALPVEEGGLGLPKDNTPEMRAEAMGFDKEVLHGTSSDIDKVIVLPDGRRYVNPFYTTADNSQEAAEFASQFANTKSEVGSPRVMPLMIRGNVLDTRNNPEALKKLQDIAEKSYTELKIGEKGLPTWGQVNNYATEAKNAGIDSILLDERSYLNSIANLNPNNIRSRFAAFDPMRRNEADILAGVLPLGLLADEEQRKKIYELMPSLLGQ